MSDLIDICTKFDNCETVNYYLIGKYLTLVNKVDILKLIIKYNFDKMIHF